MKRNAAFTLVELLVVIAIMGILIGMVAPAVQRMREVSRRSQCASKITYLGLALHQYHDRYLAFPSGSSNPTGPILSEPKGFHHNWISGLLPMLDQDPLDRALDRTVSIYQPPNAQWLRSDFPPVICPSASNHRPGITNYAAIVGTKELPIDEKQDGMFILNRQRSIDDVSDGLSNTLFLGEKLWIEEEGLGWLSGTRASLRNVAGGISFGLKPPANLSTKFVGSLSSDHGVGVYLLTGAGEVKFATASMDQQLLMQVADPDDGAVTIAWMTQ